MPITCFLNLDGVLHPARSFIDSRGKARVLRMGSEPLEWARHIADIVELRDIQFVICSSWLSRMTLQQLREQAPKWMRPRIVGACAQHGEYDELRLVNRHRTAWSVIDAYVRDEGIEHWLAVDHTDEGWPDDGNIRARLVLCDPETGLGGKQTRAKFSDVVRRETKLAGDRFSATLAVTLEEYDQVTVQERWTLRCRLPSGDSIYDVPVTLIDERTGLSKRVVVGDYSGMRAHTVAFALRAICIARFQTVAAACQWEPHYRWNRVSFGVDSVVLCPIGLTWLQLVAHVHENECLVAHQHDGGCIAWYWRLHTEADRNPLELLTREADSASPFTMSGHEHR